MLERDFDRRSSSHRGFTVLEMMIALAILLVISAIVVPLTISWVRSATKAEASEQLEAALWSARALSGERNTRVTLIAEPSTSQTRLWAVYDDPSFRPSSSGAGGKARVSSRVPVVTLSGSATALLRRQPAEQSAEGSEEIGETSSDLVLAVFLPDGSAVVAPGVSISDTPGERARELVIDSVALTVRDQVAPNKADDSATADGPP